MPREDPLDVERGADEIVARLKKLGIPCTVYEPQLFLGLPKPSRLEVGGETFEAKPSSFSAVGTRRAAKARLSSSRAIPS